MRTDTDAGDEAIAEADFISPAGKPNSSNAMQADAAHADAEAPPPTRAHDKRSEWLRKLDEECPYQVVLPRGPSGLDDDIMKFLNAYVGQFDMYAEDEYAVFVRYCFADPLDAAIFRSRFENRAGRLRLAG
jgi:hypothetical protein